jgi:hypothetical protein
MRAKLLNAFDASHLALKIGVPVNIGFNGSGLHACLTSRQVLRSSFGARLLLVGSPCAGFQDKDRPSECTCNTRRRDLHHLDLPCLTTVIPALNRATKHRTIKSDALVHPVAGLKLGRYIGILTSCDCVAVEREAADDCGW